MANPKLKVSLTSFDIILEVFGIVILVLMIGFILKNFGSLPDKIPSHFDTHGNPNSYGGKGSVILFPVVSIIIYIGLSILNRYPHTFNFPVNVTDSNVERIYSIATRSIRILKLLVVSIFAIIAYQTINVSLGKSEGMNPTLILIIILVLLLSLITMLIQFYRNK